MIYFSPFIDYAPIWRTSIRNKGENWYIKKVKVTYKKYGVESDLEPLTIRTTKALYRRYTRRSIEFNIKISLCTYFTC